jgi:pimeloyl-ACP methyl ester carboxylesterase
LQRITRSGTARRCRWAAICLALAAGCAKTDPPPPGGIAALEQVEIGGVSQWIRIRGRSIDNPVLLWLHGGPGAAQMPLAHTFDSPLEEHFVVVHWDQRGAGKSNPFDFDESTMTFERFVADTHELTGRLRERFGGRRIFLLGHSWGAQLGITVASRYPEDYQAYIGVSQVVGRAHAYPVARAWLQEVIEVAGNESHRRELQNFGSDRIDDHDAYVRFAGLVDEYGGNMDVAYRNLAWVALRAPEYTPLDLVRWLRGANRGSGPMWREPAYADFDAFTRVPRLDLPVFFINGRNDYNTPARVVRAYYLALDAPRGKRLYLMADVAHTPFLADPAAFAALLGRIREEARISDRAGESR